MSIIKSEKLKEFTAGDNSKLKEILNPLKDNSLKLRYSLAHATVDPYKETNLHKLKTSEVYYILEGEGQMHINGKTEKIKPGDTVYIEPNAKQKIKNTGKSYLKFICIVDPAWEKKDETVF